MPQLPPRLLCFSPRLLLGFPPRLLCFRFLAARTLRQKGVWTRFISSPDWLLWVSEKGVGRCVRPSPAQRERRARTRAVQRSERDKVDLAVRGVAVLAQARLVEARALEAARRHWAGLGEQVLSTKTPRPRPRPRPRPGPPSVSMLRFTCEAGQGIEYARAQCRVHA